MRQPYPRAWVRPPFCGVLVRKHAQKCHGARCGPLRIGIGAWPRGCPRGPERAGRRYGSALAPCAVAAAVHGNVGMAAGRDSADAAVFRPAAPKSMPRPALPAAPAAPAARAARQGGVRSYAFLPLPPRRRRAMRAERRSSSLRAMAPRMTASRHQAAVFAAVQPNSSQMPPGQATGAHRQRPAPGAAPGRRPAPPPPCSSPLPAMPGASAGIPSGSAGTLSRLAPPRQ